MRDRLLEFELSLDVETSEEVVEYPWGRAYLSPRLPLAWDTNWILIERAEMTAAEIVAAADDALSGCEHRALAIRDEALGTKAAPEIAALPGWSTDTHLYMSWRGSSAPRPSGARETVLAECEDLRRALIRAEFDPDMRKLEEATDQLLEMSRRFSAAGGDRWFVSPPDQPASACCLLERGGIGQVEDVGTLPGARGHGHGKAVTAAALAASRAAGHEITFLVADADDWPRLMYAKLGFEPCGVLHVLRRGPTDGTTA